MLAPEAEAEMIASVPDLERAWGAIKEGRMTPQQVADQYTNLEYNVARHSLQALDRCTGKSVIASLPIPPEAAMTSDR